MNPTLVILAAGLGSRYGGLKQIDKLGPSGETLLEYSMYDALQAGFKNITLIIRSEHQEMFEQQLAPANAHLDISYAYQAVEVQVEKNGQPLPIAVRSKPWGTAQAILSVDFLTSPFAVINADDYYGPHSYKVMHQYLQNQSLDHSQFAVIGYPLGSTLSKNGHVSRAILDQSSEGGLLKIVEHTRIEWEGEKIMSLEPQARVLTQSSLASMNFWGFTPALFPALHQQFVAHVELHGLDPKSEFFLPSAINHLIESGIASVQVLPAQGNWMGMTYAKDGQTVSRQITQLIAEGLYPKHLWK